MTDNITPPPLEPERITPPEPPKVPQVPMKAGWICLAIAWVFFLLPIPVLSFLGGALFATIALVISIVALVQGMTAPGLTQLLVNLIGSPIVYFIGWLIFGGALLATGAMSR